MDNQQLSNEIEWRQVIEYSHYEVNQNGEIRHKERKKILKPRANKGGYQYVNFKINGKKLISPFIELWRTPSFLILTATLKLIILIMIKQIIA